MASVELRFLGDYQVCRDGEPLPLPPSKKTRALLAYLALKPKPHRRESLCELLWQIPDDPRGALRWSLSKLRRLIDDEQHPRVIADRATVAIDVDTLSIDVVELQRFVADIEDANVDALEAASRRFDGNFLEGLELSNFHDFHGWCVAERERSLRNRVTILQTLVERLQNAPDRAAGYARRHVALSPYDEDARAALVRLLYSARRPAEAEEQFQLGLRMLREAGLESTGALARARLAPRIDRPMLPRRTSSQARGVRRRPTRRPLVGRSEELEQVRDVFHRATQASRPGLLLVCGPPGIGKTRLLEAMYELAKDEGAFILRSSAFESDLVRPFSLWIDAMRTADVSPVSQLFEAPEAPGRERLFGALSELVARASTERPIVLMFDDIHWCDESSAAALHYVLRMNRDRPVFVVATAREGDLRDNAAMQLAIRGLRRDTLLRELPLGPLSADALSELIVQCDPDSDHERLREECGGNPLLAIELARAERDGSGRGSLTELVRERLARFTVNHGEVLRWAAVLRPRFDVPKLVQATGFDVAEVSAALEIGEHQGILTLSGPSPKFSHDLIAQAVYADISPLRRQVMHRCIARRLEDDAELDLARSTELAHHASQSRDAGLAARAMVAVGRLCLRYLANADARSVAGQGLQFAAALSDAERVCREIELHDILQTSGPLEDPDASAAHYTALAERALDHGAVVHARLGYHMASNVRWTQGKWSKAREHSLQAGRVARGAEATEQIIGLAETAKCLVMLERDLAHADAMLTEAEELARRGNIVHPAIPAGLGMLRLHEDRLDEAEDLLQQFRTLCKSTGDRVNEFMALEHLAMVDLQRGRVHRARATCDALLSLGERIREGSEAPFARALLGLCTYTLDDDDERLQAALQELRQVDAKYRLAYILTRAALVDCERGRKALAVARAEEALACASVLERPTEMLLAHAVLACGAVCSDPKRADRHAEAVRQLTSDAAVWAGDIAARLDARVTTTTAVPSYEMQ